MEADATGTVTGQKTTLTRRGGHGRKTFLTLGTQLTLAAIADAGCIQQAKRTVSFWTTFLRKKPMVGGTEETSISLQGESRSGEASCKRAACPLGRTINRGFWRRLGDWRRPGITSRRKFDRAHRGGKQVLPEFQTNYGGTVCQDSFWARIRQNSTVRETHSYLFRYTCAGV